MAYRITTSRLEWGCAYCGLNQFFDGYLNQDYDLCGDVLEGDVLEGIVRCYKESSSKEDIEKLIDEIQEFKVNNSVDLDSAFESTCEREISIRESWGYTAASFLDRLTELLKDG